MLRARTHRELVHVRLAYHHRARPSKLLVHMAVVRRDEVVEDLRTGRRARALRDNQVLHRDRDARQRRRHARGETRVGLLRLLNRQLRRNGDVGVHFRLDRLDPRQHRFGQFDRRELLRPQPFMRLMRREPPELVAVAPGGHSSTARTRKKPSSWTGAFASASACESEGATKSARMTLERGRGCAVGSSPSVSTAASSAKWSRMPESWGVNRSTSASVSAMRASRAIWRTSSAVRDIRPRLQRRPLYRRVPPDGSLASPLIPSLTMRLITPSRKRQHHPAAATQTTGPYRDRKEARASRHTTLRHTDHAPAPEGLA